WMHNWPAAHCMLKVGTLPSEADDAPPVPVSVVLVVGAVVGSLLLLDPHALMPAPPKSMAKMIIVRMVSPRVQWVQKAQHRRSDAVAKKSIESPINIE